eukprot:CAMPEP_0206132146 /NCGR_PEP_ID=MMETSP1472-20131121/48104_1 /ASSEMBLY_ACC=CAM_ASM_001108 /TAXON_ID=41880 /ORGANISM="Pycnococcus provasolii, Strain RCC251" /LENGTH=51 /DNA_ID=CAMNT_0053523635 /DNA_START=140 /DNA_END=293 /DNA_ORIENTATION=+
MAIGEFSANAPLTLVRRLFCASQRYAIVQIPQMDADIHHVHPAAAAERRAE